MYRTHLQFEWSYQLSQPLVNNIPRSNSPLYFTGCTKLYPAITFDQPLCAVTGSPSVIPVTNGVDGRLQLNSHPKTYESPVPLTRKQDKTSQMPSRSPQTIPVGQQSTENILGMDVESIIQLVKSATSQPATDVQNSEQKDETANCDSNEVKRGLKRHHDPIPSSPDRRSPERTAASSKRRCIPSELGSNEEATEPVLSTDSRLTSATIVQDVPTNLEAVWEKVSKTIWQIYIQNKQTEEMYTKKTKLREVLYNLIKDIFPFCGLYIVGSSLNTLGTNSSDLDLCMMLSEIEIDQEIEATNILRVVLRVISRFSFVQNAQLIRAKVPILKFCDSVSGVDVDLNINNAVGIRNTQLMHSYARLDWRVQPLVLFVKVWAKEHDINDAKNMTLSSYSLVLMVMHFLQYGVKPPVIPCLQQMMPSKFLPNSDVRQLVLKEELPSFQSENNANLGELMLAFLEYYTFKFNFSKDVISVRTGGLLPKQQAMNCRSPKNKRGQWKLLSIEEPFDQTNTARSVYDEDAFQRILTVFKSSFEKLKATKDLASILNLNSHLS